MLCTAVAKEWAGPVEAAESGHTEVLRVLLQRGANINAVAGDLGTPLQHAVAECHEAAVEALLAAGAAVDTAAASGDRPLFVAVYKQHLGLVQRLLQAGADSNAVILPADSAPGQVAGVSVMAYAASFPGTAILKALQLAGGRSSAVRAFGHDALEGAIKQLVNPDGHGSLGILSAVLADGSFAPVVAATCKALAHVLDRRAHSVGAQLQLHLYRRCQVEGKECSVVAAGVYAGLQMEPPCNRSDASLALLRGWQAHTAASSAAHGGLAARERDATAIQTGIQHLALQQAPQRPLHQRPQ